MWKTRLWIITLLLVGLCAPIGVHAQNAVSLSSVTVDLWPEFDRPSLLVIQHITLAPTVSLPAQVTFRIPEEAGEPHAVAVRDPSGELFSAQYQRQVNAGWGEISLTANTAEVQLEYYIDLEREGNRRQFAFTWLSDYPVENLIVDIQQPVDTTTMDVTPAAQVVQRADGAYYRVNPGQVGAGQPFEVQVNYEKTSETLTIETMSTNEENVPAVDVGTGGGPDWQAILPAVLAAAGALLVVGGIWWFWTLRRAPQTQTARRGRRRSPRQVAEPDTGEAVYCHQCGKRSQPGDVFCRVCGTKLRFS